MPKQSHAVPNSEIASLRSARNDGKNGVFVQTLGISFLIFELRKCVLDKYMQKSLYLQVMILCFVFVLILLGCTVAEQPKRTSNLPPHHTSTGFRNPNNNSKRSFGDFLRWRFGWGPQETPALSPKEIPAYKPQVVQPNMNRIKNPDSTQIQITWIGHATFLIQVEAINILTDPMFSERCSPLSFVGPKRLAQPGINFEDLPLGNFPSNR
ncbi:MAG: hypothetical protein ACE5IW_08155 [bacterium]